MRNILLSILTVAWGLWFGSLAALFLFAQRLFAVQHSLGAQAAPHLFLVFGPWQITLGILSLIAVLALRFTAGRSLRMSTLLMLVLLALALAIVFSGILTPRAESLRLAGQSASDAFRRLHGISMLVGLVEAFLLLGAGVLLPLLPKK